MINEPTGSLAGWQLRLMKSNFEDRYRPEQKFLAANVSSCLPTIQMDHFKIKEDITAKENVESHDEKVVRVKNSSTSWHYSCSCQHNMVTFAVHCSQKSLVLPTVHTSMTDPTFFLRREQLDGGT